MDIGVFSGIIQRFQGFFVWHHKKETTLFTKHPYPGTKNQLAARVSLMDAVVTVHLLLLGT